MLQLMFVNLIEQGSQMHDDRKRTGDCIILFVRRTKTMLHILIFVDSYYAVHYLCDFPAINFDMDIRQFIITTSSDVTNISASRMYLCTGLK
jgi:hypothetical protein